MFIYCPKHGWFSRDEYFGNMFITTSSWPCLICYKYFPIIKKENKMNDFEYPDADNGRTIKTEVAVTEVKRGRGRPKGSKNKPKPVQQENKIVLDSEGFHIL